MPFLAFKLSDDFVLLLSIGVLKTVASLNGFGSFGTPISFIGGKSLLLVNCCCFIGET